MSDDQSRHTWIRLTTALVLYLGLGFSLGWYYTFTYYGNAGWPMPMPEPCGALLLYYFSVINAATEIQAVHWMVVFPLAGGLWAGVLTWFIRRATSEPVPFAHVWIACAWAALPLALMGPPFAVMGGWTDDGFVFERMIKVALRRGNRSPDAWLSPLCFALGLVGFAAQFVALRKIHGLPMLKSVRLYLTAAIAFALVCSVLGAVLSLPLRLIFE
jgi:hypothetical protein